MKSVLTSIHPKWCELIASGKKTIEVRKTAPKQVPFKAYIYETYDKKYVDIGICWGNGKCFEHGCKKVIGEFVCDYIDPFFDDKDACLSSEYVEKYANGKVVYGWHISDLKIYDKPRELSDFGRGCVAEHINEIHCRDCKKPESFDDFCEVMCKPLNRPPRSWCYVEELL